MSPICFPGNARQYSYLANITGHVAAFIDYFCLGFLETSQQNSIFSFFSLNKCLHQDLEKESFSKTSGLPATEFLTFLFLDSLYPINVIICARKNLFIIFPIASYIKQIYVLWWRSCILTSGFTFYFMVNVID